MFQKDIQELSERKRQHLNDFYQEMSDLRNLAGEAAHNPEVHKQIISKAEKIFPEGGKVAKQIEKARKEYESMLSSEAIPTKLH